MIDNDKIAILQKETLIIGVSYYKYQGILFRANIPNKLFEKCRWKNVTVKENRFPYHTIEK